MGRHRSQANSGLGGNAAAVVRWFGACLLAILLFGIFAPEASASAAHPSNSGAAVVAASAPSSGIVYLADGQTDHSTITDSGDLIGNCQSTAQHADPLRALDRWGDATTSLHVRLKSLFDFGIFSGVHINDPLAHITNGMLDGIFLNGGNWAWQTAEGMTVQAEQFCLLYKLGASIDSSAAAFGNAIFDPSGSSVTLAVILIGIGILVALWRAYKNSENPSKYLMKVGAIVGLAAVLISGAGRTTTGDTVTESDGTQITSTKFGWGSPGWLAAVTNRTMSMMEQMPARALGEQTAVQSAFSQKSGANDGSPGTCARFLENMHAAYQKSDGSVTAGVVSNMWEGSGMLLWARAQFGSKGGAQYGDKVACLVLDAMAGAESTPTVDSTDKGYPANATTIQLAGLTGKINPLVLIPPAGKVNSPQYMAALKEHGFDLDTLENLPYVSDQAGVAYAACRWSAGADGDTGKWVVDNNWKTQFDDGGPITDENCQQYWSKPFTGPNTGFDITADNSTQEGNSIESDFLGSWHGKTNNGSTLMGSIAYMISSFLMLFVFGGMSLGVIIAKTVMCVLVIFIFLMLLLELIPSRSDQSRVLKFCKFFASMSLASYSLGLVLAVISIVTGFMVGVGQAITDPGSVSSMLWLGFAPLAAVFVIHMVFKHVLNLPSPMKISSAMAYAGMAGGIGGAAAGGIDRMASRSKMYGRRAYYRGRMMAARGGSGGSGLGKFFGGAAAGVAGSELMHHHGGNGGAKGATAAEAALRRDATQKQSEQIDEQKSRFTASAEGREAIRAAKKQESRAKMKRSLANFAEHPIRGTWRAVKGGIKGGAKVGAAAGLIGLTGGLGAAILAPFVARRVGRNVIKRRREDQERTSRVFMEHAETKELAMRHDAERRVERQQYETNLRKSDREDGDAGGDSDVGGPNDSPNGPSGGSAPPPPGGGGPLAPGALDVPDSADRRPAWGEQDGQRSPWARPVDDAAPPPASGRKPADPDTEPSTRSLPAEPPPDTRPQRADRRTQATSGPRPRRNSAGDGERAHGRQGGGQEPLPPARRDGEQEQTDRRARSTDRQPPDGGGDWRSPNAYL